MPSGQRGAAAFVSDLAVIPSETLQTGNKSQKSATKSKAQVCSMRFAVGS